MKARFIALAALVLGLASCQQEFNGVTPVGGEVDFQLQVDARELATRAGENGAADDQNSKNSAFGAIDYYQGTDWKQVDLRYTLEVYDADALNDVPVKDRQVVIVDEYQPVTFDLRLVPNRNYQFVVFADFVENGKHAEDVNPAIAAQRDLGLHHVIGNDLRDITIKEDAINDESTDAYFCSKMIRVENSKGESIVLKRPYGKVRVIATDLAELNLNVDPTSVVVTYDACHPNTFNAVTGAISGEYTEKSYTYNYADISKVSLANHYYTVGYDAETITAENGTVRHSHMTLFTDYILAEDEQAAIHFTMTVKDGNEDIKTTEFNTDIPVERNHLTTIIGNVLTTATEINVTIDDNFEGYHNIEMIYVSSFRELYEAVNNYKQGQIINFEADIIDDDPERDIVILQEEDINVVINGDGYKFDGTITINGDARYDGKESVLLQNIHFYTNEAKTFIDAPTKMNGRYNYSHNITVDGCTFEAEAYNEDVVGIKLLTTYNAVVKNSSAKNIHSLAQFQSVDNETKIENVKVENCKNGISLGNMAKATIKDVKISAKGYGIRLDGEKSRTVAATIENAEISAYIPVNIRKMNNEACNADVEFIGENNVLTGSSDYEIAFCSNEYEEGVDPQSPVGTFRLQNAEEARAYYGDITTFSAFDAAINSTNNPEVVVESAITKKGLGVEVERDVTIDFAGYEFNAGSTANSYWYALEIYGDYDVNIKNANFTRAGIFAGENANVVFENGIIKHNPERTSRYIFCAKSGATITVKDGTFTNDRAKNSFFWADAATIVVEGGNFGGVASNNKVVTSNGGKVIIKGGTFNFDPTAWVAEDHKVTKVASNKWEVALDTVATEDIATVLANAAYETIYLAEGVDYGTVTAGELNNVTIVGGEGSVLNFVTDANSNLENVTLKSVNFVYDGTNVNSGIVINAGAKIENLVVEGCSFVGTGAKAGRGIYGQNSAATITLKNCSFKDLGYPVYTMAAGGYASLVVEGCTFEGIKSWAIMPQYNDYTGDLTVTGNQFINCVGGLVKAGKFTAGHTFTFTNNVVTNSAEHPAKNWFTIDTTAAAKVVENNTKDGQEWTPAEAEGLK